MGELVASSRIELEYQVPETCVLSIVLRGHSSSKPLFAIPPERTIRYGRARQTVVSRADIVLRDQSGKTTGKNLGNGQVSNCNSVFLDVNFFSSQSEKITQARAKQKPAITSDA